MSTRESIFSNARLTAAPLAPAQKLAAQPPLGLQKLGLSTGRKDGVLYVPSSYRHSSPTPLILTLHGAGGNGLNGLSHLTDLAEQHGLILVSPDSKGSTWDFLRDGFGPDVAYTDTALKHVFGQYNIDPGRVCCSGFSDGASYALSLGLTNGDLFTHILAFSPGFMRPMAFKGKPLVYVSHGDQDRVLNVDRCSRRIVPQLQSRGYIVQYHEFHGGHDVPAPIGSEGVQWFLQNQVAVNGIRQREL
ncbi:hypothetical protein N2152v2_009638 [Parachlorella kessleri]